MAYRSADEKLPNFFVCSFLSVRWSLIGIPKTLSSVWHLSLKYVPTKMAQNITSIDSLRVELTNTHTFSSYLSLFHQTINCKIPPVLCC